ncbi:hypothetical protein O4H29_20350 [Marinobacter salarius]|uniref:hypothetical protein n=1 Tax=Marinobacter salarius TaxID=1420917 RepID=UPI0022B1F220|nr:hypothetical protein [Marinobacter salarius]MCZ4287185.1 hypothetical protein [Marinobacter salarius]
MIAVYKFFPTWAKALYVISALGFILCLLAFFTVWQPALMLAMVFEVVLVFATLIGKDKFLKSEFGEYQDRNGPPDTQDGSEARYLLFSSYLKDLELSNSHIDDCIEILEAQIRKESAPHLVAEKLTTLIVGITLGLAAAIFRSLNAEAILIAVLILGGVAVIAKMIISLFPSKLQQLHELRYFLAVYKTSGS